MFFYIFLLGNKDLPEESGVDMSTPWHILNSPILFDTQNSTFDPSLSPLDQVCSQVLGTCPSTNFLNISMSILVEGSKIGQEGLKFEFVKFLCQFRFHLINVECVTCQFL